MPDQEAPHGAASGRATILYRVTNDGDAVAAVVEDGAEIVVRTSSGLDRYPTLLAAFEAEPCLTRVDGEGEWSFESAQLTSLDIASRVSGDADEIAINGEVWYPYSGDIAWVPEDYESNDDDSVSIDLKRPGYGSPGGSPAAFMLASRAGADLWRAYFSEEIELDEPWFRERPESVALRLMSQNISGPISSLSDPHRAYDASGVVELVGHPHTNGWEAIWVNDRLWFGDDHRWHPAPDRSAASVPSSLNPPRSLSVFRPGGFIAEGGWAHFLVGEPSDLPSDVRTSIVVLPATCPNRDLLWLVHADATSTSMEVPEVPATAIVAGSDGSDWIGIAHVHPDVGEVLVHSLPGAAMLEWYEDAQLLATGTSAPGPTERRTLRPSPSALPVGLAERMQELDPLGHDRFIHE